MMNDLKSKIRTCCKLILLGLLTGAIVGTIGAVFARLITAVTALRLAHPRLLFLLPPAGLLIIFCYHRLGSREDKGTNTVISAIREEPAVPAQMAPLIALSTVLTHLSGGSVGREGAALQLGGSLGSSLGRLLRLGEEDRRILIMAGMSAAFAALFGTPLAAAVFAMEVSTVGVMYYSALVPCMISALLARQIASALGCHGISVILPALPELDLPSVLRVSAVAVLCALASIVFCLVLHRAEALMEERIRQEYLRILIAAALLLVLTALVGSQTYNGVGEATILTCLTQEGKVVAAYAFLLKMLFTAVTLAGGYKGGEIVPALFIGATLGSTLGGLFGLSTTLSAAIGMGALFCGVTNCPLASLIICFEMFGFEPLPYFMIAITLSYLFSGNFGLYRAQVLAYPKFGEH